MKFFKITDLTTDATWYVTSDSPDANPIQIGLAEDLDLERSYRIVEVKASEFYGPHARCYDPDTDDEEEDTNDECYD
jgi:hypothetical protein